MSASCATFAWIDGPDGPAVTSEARSVRCDLGEGADTFVRCAEMSSPWNTPVRCSSDLRGASCRDAGGRNSRLRDGCLTMRSPEGGADAACRWRRDWTPNGSLLAPEGFKNPPKSGRYRGSASSEWLTGVGGRKGGVRWRDTRTRPVRTVTIR